MERSDGEEKRQRQGRRHTLLDLLFEFMHKSNNAKRKKKNKNNNNNKEGRRQVGEVAATQHPTASSTSSTKKQQPRMSLAHTGAIKQDKKKIKVFLQSAHTQGVFPLKASTGREKNSGGHKG